MGRPKALVAGPDGTPWTVHAAATMLTGGCDDVVIVLGARADEAALLLHDRPGVRTVVAPDWARGLGASLSRGLAALAASSTPVDAALVSLVDLPRLPSAAVRRVLGERAGRTGAVRQAEYAGRPGHPVLIGRAHWAAVSDHLDVAAADPSTADRGAGAWLRAVGAEAVPCADLWDGADQDRVSGP
ncbi:hypothetical protein BIU96_08250 [Curtobacterium sp. MCBA15_008]|nr:hypothetical protein BIU96_08250 [Curtobacterium sp. MCBA15_008]